MLDLLEDVAAVCLAQTGVHLVPDHQHCLHQQAEERVLQVNWANRNTTLLPPSVYMCAGFTLCGVCVCVCVCVCKCVSMCVRACV